MLESAVEALDVDDTVNIINIGSEEEAVAQRFIGSPTIRVNGLDVEKSARDNTDYAMTCRVYRTEKGLRHLPPEEWVRQAILEAAHS